MAEYIYDFKEPPDPEGYRGRLIRCKDCKHSVSVFAQISKNDSVSLMCNRHGIATWWDNYCSWGKREEE